MTNKGLKIGSDEKYFTIKQTKIRKESLYKVK